MVNSKYEAEFALQASRKRRARRAWRNQTGTGIHLLLLVLACILSAVPELNAQSAFQFMPGDQLVRPPAYARVPAGYACYQRPAHYVYGRRYSSYYPTFIYCVPPARPQQPTYATNARPYGVAPVVPPQAPRQWGNSTVSPYPPQPDYWARTNSVPAPSPSPYPGYAAGYSQPPAVRQIPAASQEQYSSQQGAYVPATTGNRYATQADPAPVVGSAAVYRSPQVQQQLVQAQPAVTQAPKPKQPNAEVSTSDVIKGINTTATVIHSMDVIGSALDDFFDFIVEIVGAIL